VRQLALRGAEAMQRGNSVEAERCFHEAIKRQPQDERCHALLAELRHKQGRSQESTEHLERAVRLSGDNPQLLVELGEQLLAQGSREAALDCAARALQQDASSSAAWILKARLLRQQQNSPASIVAYHRALQIDPNHRDAAIELAEVYLREGRLERCLSTLDSRALATTEAMASGEPEFLRGMAYARMERHADATLALAEAERKGVRSPELYYQLAASHHHTGSPGSARLALAEARKMAPQDERFARLEAAIDGTVSKIATRPRRQGS
jgi:tetratricopeptide (TPR) repeat protein